MASASDAIEDSLVTAQRALAVVYEDAYPCSNRVRQGLEGILNQRYGGSQHEFTNKFITPTISFLKRLKAEKGFPLVKEGKVIVHLLAPSNHLESGEMFYQVGITTPGTLALKFTKYQGNVVVMRPGAINEQELHLAFTQQYVENMRRKATKLGDQLMRVLLTSRENGQGVYVIDKIEVKKIMPECHTPVMETGMPKSFEASDSQYFPATGNCSDQARYSQTGPEPGRQPQEHSFGTSANSPPLLVQAVRDDRPKPANGHQADDHSPSGLKDNPRYPPLVQAVQDDPTTAATGDQSQEHASAGHRSNPPYPPLAQVVQDDPSSPAAGHQSEEQSSSRSGPNPVYPPVVEAVQDDRTTSVTGDQSQEHSSTGHRSNQPYPPLAQVVQDDPSSPVAGHQSEEQSSSGNGPNPVYPPVVEAVQDDRTTSVTGDQSQEHLSTDHTSNSEYPPIMQAARDNPLVTPATDQQLVNNPAHSPRAQATGDDSTTTVRDRDPCMPVDDLDLF